ncbi:neuroendocrine protein 7B2 isoform X2 [Parasteatoda tepidariorum]|uniref:neuroendocrine protein 7B2 isoform X2 n=1 Tax=Parasteatoda tepidariorum TaxID=114398 RepID=UPI00077FC312|nr:neuroendocrine protein 7B2 isoform X2 [Parasteatoda tepidariorum]
MDSLTSVSRILWTTLFVITAFECNAYSSLDSLFTDSLLREFVNRNGAEDASFDEYLNGLPSANAQTDVKDYPSFEARRDDILERDMNIRDEEYLEHSSLSGQKSMQGGNGEGYKLLKPDGSISNHQFIKTDSLPAFCNPANPCPLGFKAEDGCLEEFENTARFSRQYQAAQNCLCDSEHMFDCQGASRENEIDVLARSFENEGLADATLDKLMQNMDSPNPFLEGEKLPVVAKKAPLPSIK